MGTAAPLTTDVLFDDDDDDDDDAEAAAAAAPYLEVVVYMVLWEPVLVVEGVALANAPCTPAVPFVYEPDEWIAPETAVESW